MLVIFIAVISMALPAGQDLLQVASFCVWLGNYMRPDKLFNSTIGSRIRWARKAHKLKQDELAQQIGVSTVTINRYENDHRIPPSNVVMEIAGVLGCSSNWILAGGDEGVGDNEFKSKVFGASINGYEEIAAKDPVLSEIFSLLINDLPETKEQILKILVGRKQLKEALSALGET